MTDAAIAIDHRTPRQVAAARADDDADQPDPKPDSAKVLRPEWLVVIEGAGRALAERSD